MARIPLGDLMRDGVGEVPASGPERPAENAPAPVRTHRATRPGATSSEAKTTKKEKVGFYQLPSDTDRARGAFLATRSAEGYRTWSELVDAALMAKVRELEERYNGGEPFPDVPAGEVPTGRPMGM